MVVQFLRSFGKVLGLDPSELPTLGIMQEGLLNLGNSMGQVQDLLVRLLSSAVSDPGLPQGHRVRRKCLQHYIVNVISVLSGLLLTSVSSDPLTSAQQRHISVYIWYKHASPVSACDQI